MIPLQTIVVHLSVTFVANAVQSVIGAGKLPPLVAAGLAYRTTAPLAVLLRIAMDQFECSCEVGLADLTIFGIDHPYIFQVVHVW